MSLPSLLLPGPARRGPARWHPVAGAAAAILVMLLRLPAALSAGTPDLFDQLHARIAAAEAKRQTVRARFTETTTTSLLTKPSIRHGMLLGAKPSRIAITYDPPDPSSILMDGRQLVVIRPSRTERDRVERIDIADIMKKVDKYFANASPDELRRAFAIRAFPNPDEAGGFQIDLSPKRKQIKQGLEHLQIWVSPDYMLSQIKMTFAGGDTDVFKLDSVELNVPIPPHAFDVPDAPRKGGGPVA